MKLPVEWINHYLPTKLSAKDMAAALEAAGLEADAIQEASNFDPGLVVGQLSAVEAHPNADKLVVCTVGVGDRDLTIVTGAANVTDQSVGRKVVVAQVGSNLPGGDTIKSAKLRGVESLGMMCSLAELGLGDDHSGIWFTPKEWKVGESLSKYISVTDVIDATTAANRWDLNGIAWVSREVAAQTNQLTSHILSFAARESGTGPSIKVDNPEQVDRYMLAEVEADVTRPTPAWMTDRLRALGIRSINIVVDITNYVMLELAQPLHAFDAGKVNDTVTVRLAQPGEKLTTLDGIERKLDSSDLMITDSAGPIGFAGVMGGANSQIDNSTTRLYLESASFNGAAIRKTAIRHGLRTDASARFERRLPVDSAAVGLQRALELLEELAGGRVVGVSDLSAKSGRQLELSTRAERINTVLGLELTPHQIKAELVKLSLEVTIGDRPSELKVTLPWWRPDLMHEDDLAEEVIKLVGYDLLPTTLPVWRPPQVEFDRKWARLWQAKNVLISSALFEVMTYSFISAEQVTSLGRPIDNLLKLKNPLSIEQAYLRTDLLPSLIRVGELNRSYRKEFGLFEFSKVYLPNKSGELPDEPNRLAVLVRANQASYRRLKSVLDRLLVTFGAEVVFEPSDVETGVSHPTRTAIITLGGHHLGWIGQLHPNLSRQAKLGNELAYMELDWDLLVNHARVAAHRAVSRFPVLNRDLSFEVGREVLWQELKTKLANYKVEFINDYYGDGKPDQKVITIRLGVSYLDRTPTDQDADRLVAEVTGLLHRELGARLKE